MKDTKELIEDLYELRGMLSRIPFNKFPEDLPYSSAIATLIEIKAKLESLEDESLCDACEWFKNPGACPDYDESKCRHNGPMEEEIL